MKAHKCSICGKKWYVFHPIHSKDDKTWDNEEDYK